MIGGVNFQPGGDEQDPRRRAASNGSQQGVQEAIKVLSLRLPKVVGAQAVAPGPLLRSQGSGGNPNVDSMVERVLAQMFGNRGGAPASAPMHQAAPQAPPAEAAQGPNFWGQFGGQQQHAPQPDFWGQFNRMPNIVIENPPTWGTDADLSSGGPPPPGGMIGGPPPQIPSAPPSLKPLLDWVPAPSREEYLL
jgi:hypothetical protein